MSVPEGGTPSAVDLAAELARELVAAAGGHVEAVILYGSHLLRASPDRHSAYDFVVVVDDYSGFYRSLKASGEIHRPAWLLSGVARVLPPNAIAFTPDDGREGMAKCLVVSSHHFGRALGPRPKDHFLLGRMIQRVAVVWTRGDEAQEWVEATLAGARRRVLTWVGPYLDDSFDAAAVGRRILEVCYRGEFRPEAQNRSQTIFQAQEDHFVRELTPVLAEAAAGGALTSSLPAGDGEPSQAVYRFVTPPGLGVRLRWRWHFVRSKARTTARWLKHVVTFDNWLPYITRKVERRMGTTVELTPLERRLPIIFLWPRVIRTLRARPKQESDV